MLKVQSLLKHRLAKYLPGIHLESLLVFDWCADQHRAAAEEIAVRFDSIVWKVPPEHGAEWGLRKGTNYAATLGAETACANYLLRIIQDAYVYDPAALAALIREATEIPGNWIAANVHHYPTTDHADLCRQMGLDCDSDLHYPNGAVTLAPVKTWREWYVPMPACINHYFDDIMFGESFRQNGPGTIIDWPPCSAHRHDLDAVTSSRIHRTQLLALEEKPDLIEPARREVTLSVCLIVRNEVRYIAEWLEFHRLVGVERFFIYDDESTDGTVDIIRRRDRGDIVVVPWGRKGNDSPQISAYRHFVENFRNETRWVAFIDADEYLFSPTRADLREIILRYELTPYHGAVFVNWLFFGDNGHATRPTGTTIESYTRRGFAGVPNCQGKSIARTSLIGGFGPCGPHNVLCRDNGLTVNEHESWVAGCDSNPASIDLLRLNHYFHRSQEEATEKCQREDRNMGPGLRRTAPDMARHNLNDVDDTEVLYYLPALRQALGR